MLNLLKKFEQVEIKMDTRITQADKNICEIHQNAYEKARLGLLSMVEQLSALEQEQNRILLAAVDKYSLDSYINGCKSIKSDDIYNNLDKTHETFINFIVQYFADHYQVSIDIDGVKDALLPREPDSGWRYNEAEIEEYTKSMRSLKLCYKDILEQIFIQLDGYSFQDKAVKELKDAAHEAAWNSYMSEKNYEQKKATIKFSNYACHFDSFFASIGRTHISLSDSMKKIIYALSHFEYGTVKIIDRHFATICGYSFDKTQFDFELEKTKQIKCFKNGRVDIRFTSEAYARQFVEEYLGTEYYA